MAYQKDETSLEPVGPGPVWLEPLSSLDEENQTHQELHAKPLIRIDSEAVGQLEHCLKLREIESLERRQRMKYSAWLLMLSLLLAAYGLSLGKDHVSILVLTNVMAVMGGMYLGRVTEPDRR